MGYAILDRLIGLVNKTLKMSFFSRKLSFSQIKLGFDPKKTDLIEGRQQLNLYPETSFYWKHRPRVPMLWKQQKLAIELWSYNFNWKSRVRETKQLSTDADSSTNTKKIQLVRQNLPRKNFFLTAILHHF